MSEIILRWSPERGFLVVPGDDLIREVWPERRPQVFGLKGEKLVDPDRFNAAAQDHGWPKLPVKCHQERVKSALIACDIPTERLSDIQRLDAFAALTDLIDSITTPQDCVERLERIE